jgi:glycosyl transferase family 25
MEQLLPAHLNVTFTSDWHGPLDGLYIQPESLKGFGLFPWEIQSSNKWWSRPLKKGEIGCAISHWRCWKDAADYHEEVLILEDDVDLADNFLQELSSVTNLIEVNFPDWDLLYLGRLRLMRDFAAGSGFVRPGYSHLTIGYMLSASGIDKILSVGFENALIPADEFLAALSIPHPRPDVARLYPPILNAFAVERDIVFQLPKEQAGSDTEHSDFIVLAKQPDQIP